MKTRQPTTILAKYRTGYHEYNRIWDRASKRGTLGQWDCTAHGSFISPSGKVWRNFGVGAGCPRFWNERTNTYRDLDCGTIQRALMLGWKFVPDKDSKNIDARIKITRWRDGVHFYATVDGNDVQEGNKVKWDTHEQAYKAALRKITKK